jgi:hypothetical protein
VRLPSSRLTRFVSIKSETNPSGKGIFVLIPKRNRRVCLLLSETVDFTSETKRKTSKKVEVHETLKLLSR